MIALRSRTSQVKSRYLARYIGAYILYMYVIMYVIMQRQNLYKSSTERNSTYIHEVFIYTFSPVLANALGHTHNNNNNKNNKFLSCPNIKWRLWQSTTTDYKTVNYWWPDFPMVLGTGAWQEQWYYVLCSYAVCNQSWKFLRLLFTCKFKRVSITSGHCLRASSTPNSQLSLPFCVCVCVCLSHCAYELWKSN